MLKVLITGITGFLGSHIADVLIQNNIEVVGLIRPNADKWRCKDFEHKVIWVDLDIERNWEKTIITNAPDVIVHSAWIGVEAAEREDWAMQAKNIDFLVTLLEIGRQINLKQFVFLGSQAEYGYINGKVTESQPAIPLNAYGSIKIACLEILKTFSQLHNINWVWLRLFSLFGEKENTNWLIPSVVKKMQTVGEMDLTPGEQKYAYLYVKDFSNIVYRVITNDIKSGIYNVSSNQVHDLKSLIEHIREIVNPAFKLNFGAIPYRSSQSMHIEGDITKITNEIGPIKFTDFNLALLNTINYYTSN